MSLSCLHCSSGFLWHLEQNPDSGCQGPTRACQPLSQTSVLSGPHSVFLVMLTTFCFFNGPSMVGAHHDQQEQEWLLAGEKLTRLLIWPDWNQKRSFSLSGLKDSSEICSQKIGPPVEAWLPTLEGQEQGCGDYLARKFIFPFQEGKGRSFA